MTSITTFTTVAGVVLDEDRGRTEAYFVPDPLGSLIECRNTSGTRTYSAEYWPYGEVQTSSGSNASSWNFIGLLGYLADSAVLLYVRARYLITKWARWLTLDPLWPIEPPFLYAWNRPEGFVDPSGLIVLHCKGCTPSECETLANNLGTALQNLCNFGSTTIRTGTFDEDSTTGLAACVDKVPGCRQPFGGNIPANCLCRMPITPDFYVKCDKNCSSRQCGKAWTRGFGFTACLPQALGAGCGPTQCFIAHELIHMCGVIHPTYDDAFRCINSTIPGCKNYVLVE